MNVKYVLNRMRRKFHSRIKLHELARKIYWLGFENESILKFLAKYNVVRASQRPPNKPGARIQEEIEINNESGFVINVMEY